MAEEQAKGDEILSRTGQPLVQVRSKRKGNVANFTKNKKPPAEPPAADEPAPDLSIGAPPTAEEENGAHSSGDEIPSSHPRPEWRDKPTLGGIEMTDEGTDLLTHRPPPDYQPPDGSDGMLRTFDDLMGTFPVGDGTGQYFVNVERKKPPIWGGIATKGILRKIRQRLTIEEFKEVYGGGEYELIVYGPPRRPQVYDANGVPRPKALTKPIRLTVPYHGEGGYPPNPEASHEEDPSDENEEEMSHEPYAGIPERLLTRGVTPAAAKMVDSGLQHKERMDQREREERRREESRVQNATNETVQLLLEQSRQQKEDSAREIRELKAELQKAARTPAMDFGGLGNLVQSMNPRAGAGEIEQLRDAHRRELDTVNQHHKSELDTLNRRHSDELLRHSANHKDEMARAQLRVDQAEQRAAERVRDVESKFTDLERRNREDLDRVRNELKADHQREIDHIEKEASRTAEAQRQMYEGRLQSEQRTHDRELQTKDAIAESKLGMEKARLESELRQLKADAARREKDVEEFKRLAEKNKDIGAAIEKLRREAEAVGMVVATDVEATETDWKSMIASVAMEAAKHIPEVLKGVGDSVNAVRGIRQGGAPTQAMGQAPTVRQQLPMHQATGYRPAMVQGFATEDSVPSGSPNFPEYPVAGGVRPMPMAQPGPQPVTEMPQAQVAPAPPPAAAPSVPTLTAGQQPAPGASVPPPGAPPAAAAQPGVDPAFDALVLGGKEQLERALEAKTDPSVLAKFLVTTYGVDAVRQNLPTVSAAAMRGALQRNNLSSTLLTRDGQRYLKAIEAAVIAELGEKKEIAT